MVHGSCVPIPADAPTRSLSVASELSSSEWFILCVPRASRQSLAIGGRGGGFLMEDVRNPEEKQLFSIVFNGKIW